jgi:hypothetical protein
MPWTRKGFRKRSEAGASLSLSILQFTTQLENARVVVFRLWHVSTTLRGGPLRVGGLAEGLFPEWFPAFACYTNLLLHL